MGGLSLAMKDEIRSNRKNKLSDKKLKGGKNLPIRKLLYTLFFFALAGQKARYVRVGTTREMCFWGISMRSFQIRTFLPHQLFSFIGKSL